jgi:HPt (histidine-containing phosphotransfer) domain-containing protein
MENDRSDIVVDLAHLAQYTSGDGALEVELFDLFLTNGKAYLAAMTAASDIQSWREAAHALKGSARGIGAQRVAAFSADAEALEDATWDAERARMVEGLEMALDEVGAFVSRHYADPAS